MKRWRQRLAMLVAVLLALAVFAAYLRPAMVVGMANFIATCF
ncbi:hypothetical protein ABWL39_04510 [Chitinivorax sp. PXF-14]